jgi:hypothetical protein
MKTVITGFYKMIVSIFKQKINKLKARGIFDLPQNNSAHHADYQRKLTVLKQRPGASFPLDIQRAV